MHTVPSHHHAIPRIPCTTSWDAKFPLGRPWHTPSSVDLQPPSIRRRNSLVHAEVFLTELTSSSSGSFASSTSITSRFATMSASTSPYNLKNPAVKRILKEVKEVQEHGGREFWAEPLEVRRRKPRRTRLGVDGRSVGIDADTMHVGSFPTCRILEIGKLVRVALRHTWTARHRVRRWCVSW